MFKILKNSKFLIILLIILVIGIILSSYFIWSNKFNFTNLTTKPGFLPLVIDKDHDVVVLEECGLTIKIDKKLNLKTYKNYARSKTRLDFLDKDFHGAGANSAIQSIVDCDNRFTKEEIMERNKNNLSDPVTEIDVNNWTMINQSSKKMIKKVQKLKVDRSNDYSGQMIILVK